MAELHQYDYGTVLKAIVLNSAGAVVPVGDATAIQFFLAKPDTTVLTRTGSLTTDGSDGYIQYTVASGELNLVGIWSVQGHVVTPSGSFRTSISQFRVDENLA